MFVFQVDVRAGLFHGLDRQLLESLQAALTASNPYVRDLQPVAAAAQAGDGFQIVLSERRRPLGEHERRFNLPQSREIAVLMPNERVGHRDIVVQLRGGPVLNINEVHRMYDPLHYVLLLPHGTDGWSLQLKEETGISAREYYNFNARFRPGHFNIVPRSARLFQQYLVDAQAKVESERLEYIRHNQDGLHGHRAETVRGIRDAITAGDVIGGNVGRVVLPASFTGGTRYMMSKLQDALSYVRQFGGADLFITFTSNPQWPEICTTIRDLFGPGRQPSDHPDIVSEVFHLKLRALMKHIRRGILGQVRATVYSIEWQKRGLPHAHILVWLDALDKPRADSLDDYISAEIPDPEEDEELHRTITRIMLHGPCGVLNTASPCMKDGKCSKGYPKPFQRETDVPANSYPRYRRRSPEDGGRTVRVRAPRAGRDGDGGWMVLDNRWVIPYNPYLSRLLDAHVNVEIITHSVGCIKYVLKYITKGSDQVMYTIMDADGNQVVDEVGAYQRSRYLGAMEAAWRLAEYDIHEHYPAVEQLHVHLGGEDQRLQFGAGADLRQVVNNVPESKLTAFFRLCATDNFARQLLYLDVPRYYRWHSGNRAWQRRRRGVPHPDEPGVFITDTVGRMFTVSPRAGEPFFLRLLLLHVAGPTDFAALRTVDGVELPSYKAACQARGLLRDGRHWTQALEEAAATSMPRSLRVLFGIIMVEGYAECDVLQLWERFQEQLCEDLLRQRRREQGEEAELTQDLLDEALRQISRAVTSISGRPLSAYGLPDPPAAPEAAPADEVDVDIAAQLEYAAEHEGRLTEDQRAVFTAVMERLERGDGGVIFIDAPGGETIWILILKVCVLHTYIQS